MSHVLKSTGEKCELFTYQGTHAHKPPMGYRDVIIQREGMKNKRAVLQRVKESSIKKAKQ